MPDKSEITTSNSDFDVTGKTKYLISLQQLRQYTAQGSGESSSAATEVIQMNVRVKGGGNEATVVLFMIRSDRYIVGFVGANEAVYALKGSHKDPTLGVLTYQQLLTRALKKKQEEVGLLGFSVTHADLGTFREQFDINTRDTLDAVSNFNGDMSQQDRLKRPLSFLVCMVAEGSRFASVGGQCAQMFENERFRPDASVLNNYGKAKAIDGYLTRAKLTLKELEGVKASVGYARRRILYALHISNEQASVKDVLNYLYGRGGARELNRLSDRNFIESDVNFADAIEALMRDAPKLIGFVSKHSRQSILTKEQVDEVVEVFNALRDDDVKIAAANLA